MREWRNYSECNVEAELYPGTGKPVWSVPLTHAQVNLCLCVFLHLHHLNCGCCSVAQLCLTLCNPMDCSVPGFPVPHHLLKLPKFISIASVIPSSHLLFWCTLFIMPSVFASIRDFSNEFAVHIRWPKYWSFSISICLSNKFSEWICLQIDWFDLLAVQESSPAP